jgi:hypothetical protein
MIVRAIHKNPVDASCTHFAEGDFLRSVAHLTQDCNTGTAAITAATAETTLQSGGSKSASVRVVVGPRRYMREH